MAGTGEVVSTAVSGRLRTEISEQFSLIKSELLQKKKIGNKDANRGEKSGKLPCENIGEMRSG